MTTIVSTRQQRRHCRPPCPPGLFVGTLRNSRGFVLAQAFEVVKLGRFDLMVVTKTKISMAEYFRNRLGCNIFCLTDRPASAGGAQGGMVLVLRDRLTGWVLELIFFHGPNLGICEVSRGTSRTPIIGAYVPLTTLTHLPDLEESLERFRVKYPILLGYFNVYLDESQKPISQLVVDLLT